MNREDESLDLSALAPDEVSGHWSRIEATTRTRIDAALATRRQDPLTLIASWMKPLLVAAGVTLALLVPFEIHLEMNEASAEQVDRLVSLSSGVLHAESPATAADFVEALMAEPVATP
jgi:hypothetical protein